MTKVLIALALAATLIAMYFAPPAEDDNVVAPAKTMAKANSANSASAGIVAPAASAATTPTTTSSSSDAPRMSRYDLQIHPRTEQDLGDLFAGISLTPEPVKQAVAVVKKKPEPPPAPQAPPLPFQFLGRLIDNGQAAYFLQMNNKNLVVRVGDSIDQKYKLESASAGSLHFVYLPLQQKQSLVVGEVN